MSSSVGRLACCVISVMDDCGASDVVAEARWTRLESTTTVTVVAA